MGERKASLHEHILHFNKRQLKGNGKCNDGGLGRLVGLVRCGNCKRAMTRRKNKAGIRYFQCIHSVNNGNTDCPVGRSFPEMDIEKVVFNAITQFLTLAQKEAIQSREVGDLRKSAIKELSLIHI